MVSTFAGRNGWLQCAEHGPNGARGSIKHLRAQTRPNLSDERIDDWRDQRASALIRHFTRGTFHKRFEWTHQIEGRREALLIII